MITSIVRFTCSHCFIHKDVHVSGTPVEFVWRASAIVESLYDWVVADGKVTCASCVARKALELSKQDQLPPNCT